MLLLDTENFLFLLENYPDTFATPSEEPIELPHAVLTEAIDHLEKKMNSHQEIACTLFDVLPFLEIEDFLVVMGALLLYGVEELSFAECFAVVYARLDHRHPYFKKKECNEAYRNIPDENCIES